MTDQQPKNGSREALNVRLDWIKETLDELKRNVVTKVEFQAVQENIDDLKTTVDQKTASKWVENLVFAALVSGVGAFLTTVFLLIRSLK